MAKKISLPNIKSRYYKQEDVNFDFSNAIAGQTIFTKIMLIVLVAFSCFIVSFIAGYLGGITSLYLSVNTPLRIGYLLMIGVLIIWILTTSYNNFTQGIVASAWAVFIGMTSLLLLTFLNLLELPNQFVFTTSVFLVVGLSICAACFFTFRFAIIFIEILLSKDRLISSFIRFAYLFIVMFAGKNGCNTAFYAAKKTATYLKDILINLPDVKQEGLKTIAIISGVGLILALIIISWWVNHRRGLPGREPDMLTLLVITACSWRGTSFHNLDLSRVNFKNAKLPNTDLRARKLYRTCFQGVTGLERARVNSRYLDLEIPKVQKLLTRGCSEERDFSQLNLRGAYLQGADLRHMNFTDTDLTGADLRGADLRGCIFVRAQVIDVDFSEANLTGICIADWSVNSQTLFTNVECDYIYRKVDEKGEPTDRSPATRNFEPREFESLYQEVGNVVELVFKEGLNWRAFAFTLQQLQLDGDENLGLELKGIEKRGDLWVVKVTHNENVPRQVVEQQIYASYEELKNRLAEKEQQFNQLEQEYTQLLGIASANATAIADQASAIKELSRKAFGNSFFIVGSNITNLAGSGEIKYSEAAEQVRNIVSGSVDTTQVLSLSQNFLNQLQQQNVAIAPNLQAELIKQILLAEAEKDPAFKQILLNQSQQAVNAISESAIASAIREAIAQLT